MAGSAEWVPHGHICRALACHCRRLEQCQGSLFSSHFLLARVLEQWGEPHTAQAGERGGRAGPVLHKNRQRLGCPWPLGPASLLWQIRLRHLGTSLGRDKLPLRRDLSVVAVGGPKGDQESGRLAGPPCCPSSGDLGSLCRGE